MNKGVQALVAVACVVIIAAAGVWGWDKYQFSRHHTPEFLGHRSDCLVTLDFFRQKAGNMKPTIDSCVREGYLSQDEEEQAEAGRPTPNQ